MMRYLKFILIFGMLFSTLKAEDNSSWYEDGKSYTSKLLDKGLIVDKNSTWYKKGKEYGDTVCSYTKEYWQKSIKYTTNLYDELFKDLDNTKLQVIRKDNQINITAPGYVAFETNRADIRYEFEPVLRDISKNLLKYSKVTIKIKAYADNTDSNKSNMQLSKDRAKSIYKALSLLGIDRTKMSYEGYASSTSSTSNKPPVDMEIIFVGENADN